VPYFESVTVKVGKHRGLVITHTAFNGIEESVIVSDHPDLGIVGEVQKRVHVSDTGAEEVSYMTFACPLGGGRRHRLFDHESLSDVARAVLAAVKNYSPVR
jgi:hypothetical protein